MSQGLGIEFDRAQRRRDAQSPPEHRDCEEEGHDWKLIRVERINGEEMKEYKCRSCAKTEVV